MLRLGIAGMVALCGCVSFLLFSVGCDFTITVEFVTPDRAESTETQTVALPDGAVVEIHNELGSTRVTVDPSVTEATVEIVRVALADSQTEADAMLADMEVTITPPSGEDNTLVVDAQLPPGATDDEDSFQATITEDEINISAIVGSVLVAQYKLRITLPPGHGVEVEQDAGRVRAIGLDTASTLEAGAGSIRSIGAGADLAVRTNAGDLEVESHQGSVDAEVNAGSLSIEIVSLAADQHVAGEVGAGNIRLLLPSEVSAELTALSQAGYVSFWRGAFAHAEVEIATWTYVKATLGAGGPTVDLQTSAGNIDVDSF